MCHTDVYPLPFTDIHVSKMRLAYRAEDSKCLHYSVYILQGYRKRFKAGYAICTAHFIVCASGFVGHFAFAPYHTTGNS